MSLISVLGKKQKEGPPTEDKNLGGLSSKSSLAIKIKKG